MSNCIENPICLECLGYMLDMVSPIGWKRCNSCGYCKDFKDGGKCMLTMEELLKNKVKFADLPKDHQDNLKILLEKINKVRALYGKPMTVTSGYRSREDHIRIYKELAVKRNVPYNEKNVPFGSRHLSGSAVDISDPNGKLFKWAKDHEKDLEGIGLWMEEADDQARVHFQIVKYGSWVPGKSRFFKP